MRVKKVQKILDDAWWQGVKAGMNGDPEPPRVTHKKLGAVYYREVQYGWECGKRWVEELVEAMEGFVKTEHSYDVEPDETR